MNIAISGASGFIGKHLTEYLTEAGHRVVPLGRPMFREGTSGHLIQALSHCDVIINLAGAPISKRWTPEYKKELYDSRIKVTHCIIRAMDAVKTKPRLMISASAVGYYPEEGTFDEYTNTRGSGFLAEPLLCMGERGPPLSVADKAGNHPLRYCALTRWRGDGTNASSPPNNAGSRCDRSGYTAFPLDCYSGSLSGDGVYYQPRRGKRSFQPGGSATSFTVCIYSGNGSTLSCLDEGGRTALVLPDAIW